MGLISTAVEGSRLSADSLPDSNKGIYVVDDGLRFDRRNEDNFIILVEYGSLSLGKQNFIVSITQQLIDADQVML
ncbi:hypothetical protein Tco_0610736 [Tanacetum coccineum]